MNYYVMSGDKDSIKVPLGRRFFVLDRPKVIAELRQLGWTVFCDEEEDDDES